MQNEKKNLHFNIFNNFFETEVISCVDESFVNEENLCLLFSSKNIYFTRKWIFQKQTWKIAVAFLISNQFNTVKTWKFNLISFISSFYIFQRKCTTFFSFSSDSSLTVSCLFFVKTNIARIIMANAKAVIEYRTWQMKLNKRIKQFILEKEKSK